MPAQPRGFSIPPGRPPALLGSLNILVDGLADNVLMDIYVQGQPWAHCTLGVLREFILGTGPTRFPVRVVTAQSEAVFSDSDTILLINKTVASATPIDLPTPSMGRIIGVRDMAGNAETYNITLDAGTGKLINGLQTLVMAGNYGTTLLIGQSATSWGTLI